MNAAMSPAMNPSSHQRPRTPAALLGVVAAAAIPLVLAACNTIEGAGQDVSALGEGVTYAADQTQQAMFREPE